MERRDPQPPLDHSPSLEHNLLTQLWSPDPPGRVSSARLSLDLGVELLEGTAFTPRQAPGEQGAAPGGFSRSWAEAPPQWIELQAPMLLPCIRTCSWKES